MKILSRYSDSALIDILQEISSTIHHDIGVTEEIQKLSTVLNPFHRNYNQIKQSVFCTVELLNTHRLNIDIWRQCIDNVPRDTILSWYFAHNNDNIMLQRFCVNRYIARNFIHDTSRYLCHWRNSKCTKISILRYIAIYCSIDILVHP